MIEAKGLSKTFGRRGSRKIAVNNLSFQVEPGKVTGFVGPNGAGKSTTMRLMLGLDQGKGKVLFDGKELRHYKQPAKMVGILLEAKAFHPTRSARNHLKVLAAQSGIKDYRVDEVLDLVGLASVAKSAPGKFSLGMSQRLGLAAALLAQPKYLMLDEPANGLDPEGVVWLRNFIKGYAKSGNGVLISSHLLSELSQLADNVVVIGKGELIASSPIKQLIAKGPSSVFVRASSQAKLLKVLDKAGLSYHRKNHGIEVANARTDDVGLLAHKAGVTVLELTGQGISLEEAFLDITEKTQEYSGAGK